MSSKYLFCLCIAAFCLYSMHLAQVTTDIVDQTVSIEQLELTSSTEITSTLGTDPLVTADTPSTNNETNNDDNSGKIKPLAATAKVASDESTTIPVTSLPDNTTAITTTAISTTPVEITDTTTRRKSRKPKTTTVTTTTSSSRRRRTKTTTTLKPELVNEFSAKLNEFLELPCGYESDENDYRIKWEKVGGGVRSF
jgi:hypothetical protein